MGGAPTLHVYRRAKGGKDARIQTILSGNIQLLLCILTAIGPASSAHTKEPCCRRHAHSEANAQTLGRSLDPLRRRSVTARLRRWYLERRRRPTTTTTAAAGWRLSSCHPVAVR